MHLSIEIPTPAPPPRAKVGIWLDNITNLNKTPPYWGILTGKNPHHGGETYVVPWLTILQLHNEPEFSTSR